MKNLINVQQMADKLCSTAGSVYAKVSTRQIPGWCIVKVGKRVLFDEDAVNKWLESMRCGPLPATP